MMLCVGYIYIESVYNMGLDSWSYKQGLIWCLEPDILVQIHYTFVTTCKTLYVSLHAGTCPSLEPPENGQVALTSRIVGSIATYTCSPRFDLVGHPHRSCQSNSEWSGAAPTCQCIYDMRHASRYCYHSLYLLNSVQGERI